MLVPERNRFNYFLMVFLNFRRFTVKTNQILIGLISVYSHNYLQLSDQVTKHQSTASWHLFSRKLLESWNAFFYSAHPIIVQDSSIAIRKRISATETWEMYINTLQQLFRNHIGVNTFPFECMFFSFQNKMKPTNPNADTYVEKQRCNTYLSHFPANPLVEHPDLTH